MAASTEIERIHGVPESLWNRIRAQPERTPELIALAAAERFGPGAARWVAIAGPGHQPEELAKVAVKKHIRLSRLEGAALGLGGAFTAAPDLAALAWIQSRMVFYVAAAYGYDPEHPMRPAELLYLQGIYETPAQARESLDGVGKSMAFALVDSQLRKRNDSAIVSRLVSYVGRRAVRRAAGRFIPLIGAPIGAIQNASATGDVGGRALRYYGGDQARP